MSDQNGESFLVLENLSTHRISSCWCRTICVPSLRMILLSGTGPEGGRACAEGGGACAVGAGDGFVGCVGGGVAAAVVGCPG